MNYGAGPTDLYSATPQQQQPSSPWVQHLMQSAGGGQEGMPQQGQQQPQIDPQTARQAQVMQQQGATPQEIEAFISLQRSGQNSQQANRQRALAKQLRGDASAQLQGRDTGRFYVGPTWVNMAANLMQQNRARNEEAAADKSDAETAKKREEATRALMAALTKNQGAGNAGSQ